MRKWAVIAAAMVFGAGAVAYTPQAEARRGWGVGAGILAGALIGGALIASAHRHRAYAYYPRRAYYPRPVYYARPAYYSRPRYYAPVYRYRPVYYRAAPVYRYRYRPVRFYGAGVYAPRRVIYRYRYRW